MINYIIIAVLLVLAFLAIRRMLTRGLCDCKGKKGKGCHGSCACSCGPAAEDALAEKLEEAAQKTEASQAQDAETCACGAHGHSHAQDGSCACSSHTPEDEK